MPLVAGLAARLGTEVRVAEPWTPTSVVLTLLLALAVAVALTALVRRSR